MGQLKFNLRKELIEMNLQFFSSLILLVLAVNGTPKPDPKAIPKAAPKPNPMMMKSQPMTIQFPGGQIRGYGMVIDNYGSDYSGNRNFGNNGGFSNYGPKSEIGPSGGWGSYGDVRG